MLQKFLFICLLVSCFIGCTSESTNNESIFPTPLVPEPEPTPQPSPPPPVPVPVPQPIPEPEPEPEPVPVPEPVPPVKEGEVRDLVGPKLVDSSIATGAFDVDVDLGNIRLTFDEKIAKSDIKLLDAFNKNQGWKRFIEGKEVILVDVDAENLELAKQYSIFGIVKDVFDNERAILITFTTRAKE